MERRGSAVHPLHLRLDRQAEGRAAHHRRLSRLCRDDASSTCSTTIDGDIYWCTADVGWVTGHTYIVYGPLANGATTLMFEGVPTYPDTGRAAGEVVDKHKVNIFYTAPTAIRALMRARRRRRCRQPLARSRCDCWGPSASRSTRRPGNGTITIVGDGRCPIVDTWWQTETGGILITPAARRARPRSRARPRVRSSASSRSWSITRATSSKAPAEGNLVHHRFSWPGQMRTRLWRPRTLRRRPISRPSRASTSPATAARRDEDGYYWITGRVDDVLNVSGHRMGTAEVEIGAGRRIRRYRRSRRGRLSARHQGSGHLRLCHPDGRRAGLG